MNCIVSHLGAYPMDFDIHRSGIRRFLCIRTSRYLYLYLYRVNQNNMQMQFPTATPLGKTNVAIEEN